MKQKKLSMYFWLFRTNLCISAFTFGGGYVVIPMIRKFYVEQNNYLCEEELMEIAAIAQSSPGAIAINMTVLAGFTCAGMKGSILSAIAAVLPPFLILSLVSLGYQSIQDNMMISAILKGMQAGVAALIVDVVVTMCHTIYKEQSIFITLLIPATFIASFFFQINVAVILCCSIFLCVFMEVIHQKRLSL